MMACCTANFTRRRRYEYSDIAKRVIKENDGPTTDREHEKNGTWGSRVLTL